MNKRIVLSIALLILACAQGVQNLDEPNSSESMLVIGRVIIEGQTDYNITEIVRKGNKIGIFGLTEAGEQVHYYAYTDANGYFALPNVPPGQYAIQGVNAYIHQVGTYTLYNPLEQGGSVFRFNRGEYYTFGGEYFPFQTRGRVLSLQNHIFRIMLVNRSLRPLGHQIYPRLENVELLDGTVLNDGAVESYYIDLFPSSAWVSELEKSLQNL